MLPLTKRGDWLSTASRWTRCQGLGTAVYGGWWELTRITERLLGLSLLSPMLGAIPLTGWRSYLMSLVLLTLDAKLATYELRSRVLSIWETTSRRLRAV